MNSDATLEKARIRKQMIEARRALPIHEVRGASESVAERIKSLDVWKNTSAVLTYIPASNNEVDTWPLIHAALNRTVPVYAPRVVGDGLMTWASFSDKGDFAPGRFGIPEPTTLAQEGPWNADAVALVPGVAFTTKCHRLGQGGGYFDRFLSKFPGTAIGLAYDLQIVDNVPLEPWDRPVDWVITPTRTFSRA